jgi:hypothetical protein
VTSDLSFSDSPAYDGSAASTSAMNWLMDDILDVYLFQGNDAFLDDKARLVVNSLSIHSFAVVVQSW